MWNVMTRRRVASVIAALGMSAGSLIAQVKTNVPDPVAGAKPAIVERITIHGKALEGNLEGDAVDRDAIVFLPPSYNQSRTRRYPVVYALHGYSIGAEQWTHEIHVPQTIEGAFRLLQNQFLHGPISALGEASREGGGSTLLEALRELFRLGG